MPLAARLPCALGTRHAYASIPEEDDDDLSDVMDYAPRPEAGWWKGAWPVGVSLLLFTAAFVGSGVASHKASTTQHPINTHIRVQDRAAMRMHAQTPALPKATQASAAAPLASTSDEDSSCVASSTFSFTVSECSCDATKVVLAGTTLTPITCPAPLLPLPQVVGRISSELKAAACGICLTSFIQTYPLLPLTSVAHLISHSPLLSCQVRTLWRTSA